MGQAVGYLNVVVPQGYSLLTAPLLVYGGTNGVVSAVSNIFQGFPDTSSGSQNGFTIFTMDGTGFKANNNLNGWADPEMALLPGAAWFFKNPYILQNPTLTLAGEIPDGTNELPEGFSACGSITPFSGGLTSLMMFPAANGDQVFTFNNSNNTYSTYTFTNNNWLPDEPSNDVGQAFWVRKSAAADWVEDLDGFPAFTNLLETQPQLNSQVGQLNFFTFNATNSGFGQVKDTNGSPLSTNALGQLYAGTNSSESTLVALGIPVSFSGTVPGFISSGVVSIPFVAGGQSVYVQLRAWQSADGANFEEAYARGAPTGSSSTMTLTAHATIEGSQPGIPPPDVNAFPSFPLAAHPIPPVTILSPRLSGTNLTFSFASFSNQYYVVSTCADLTTTNWVAGSNVVSTASPIQVSLPVTKSTSQQFFRVQAVNLPE